MITKEDLKLIKKENDITKRLAIGMATNLIEGFWENMTVEEIIRSVYGNPFRYANLLLENTAKDEQEQIAQETLVVIKRILSELKPEDFPYHVTWNKNSSRIVSETKTILPELFDRIDKYYAFSENYANAIRSLKSFKRTLEDSITAHINTDEELELVKSKIYQAADRFLLKLKGPFKQEDYNLILDDLNKIKNDAIDLAYRKKLEEPVRLLYYRTGNRVAVKLNLNSNRLTYRVGRGREIKRNKGADNKLYPYILSVGYIDDFLYQNEVRDVDLLVDPNSVDQFYSYRNEVSVNLTPAFVDKWWNYDCPDLKRHVPNKDRSTNMMGMPICHFTSTLIESSWTTDFIDDRITPEEAAALTKGYEHTKLYKSIQNTLKAQTLKKNETAINEIRERVNAFNDQVQKVIDDYKSEVFEYLADVFFDRVKEIERDASGKITNLKLNDNFGLDCGFVHIRTTDKDYMENLNILRQLDSSYYPWMSIRLPYLSQSVTVEKEVFKKVKEIVKTKLNIELISEVVLD